MERLNRDNIEPECLPGRAVQKAVGKNSAIASEKMTVGFCRYSAEYGPMEPHHHAEETVLVLDAKDGWMRYGQSKDDLGEREALCTGDILHFPAWEWHVFGYGEGGYIDIAFIYGQVDNIRPEEALETT